MLILGSHVNFNKDDQLLGSTKQALSYGANTFMLYTGAPQNTMRYPIKDDECLEEAYSLMKENNMDISNIIVHAPYIVNLANRIDEDKYKFSVRFLKEEVKRCGQLGIKYLVLHPGSHVGQGVDIAINNIVEGLNDILVEGDEVIILLETMAGKGTEIGSKFEELRRIIDGVRLKSRIGVCLDTCHLNDASYDVSKFDEILDEIDEKIGLNYVKCVHINDSKNELGAHKDRHENIGYGTIGFDNLINVIYNKRLDNIPLILETPWINDVPFYKEEIEMIKKRKFNDKLK